MNPLRIQQPQRPPNSGAQPARASASYCGYMLTRDEAIAILGVAASADVAELKRAWRILALRHHPDKNPGDESSARKFQQATDAFQLLSNQTLGYKSFDELAADMDDVREGLERAVDLSVRRGANDTEGTVSQVKVMKVGPALWVGEVNSGRPHGEGDLILPNGSVHNGSFENGRAQGFGTFYDASGSVSKGTWVDNKRVGKFSTVDPKLGAWADVYDAEGKRTARKKSEPPPPGSISARSCRHCGAKSEALARALRPLGCCPLPVILPPSACRSPRGRTAALHLRRFHATFNTRCRQHSGKWMAASETNADGSPAVVDRVAFPEGGLWLCCGSKVKERGEPCSIGIHVEHPSPTTTYEVAPEGRRIEQILGDAPTAEQGQSAAATMDGERIPSFIASPFSTKVEYEAWVRERASR